MRLCVYGAASPTIDKSYIQTVEEFGKQMVQRGHSLVFGGGGNGLMGAVARGVSQMNGHILGVIPRFFGEETVELIFEGCNQLIETTTMRERKQIMEDNADAFIITPGGIGTFEEFFEILTLKQLLRHNKPMVLYNISGYYDKMMEVFKKAVEENFIRGNCYELFLVSDNVDEIFKYIETPVKEIKSIKELKDG